MELTSTTTTIMAEVTLSAAAAEYYNQGSEEVAQETPLTLKKLEKVSAPFLTQN